MECILHSLCVALWCNNSFSSSLISSRDLGSNLFAVYHSQEEFIERRWWASSSTSRQQEVHTCSEDECAMNVTTIQPKTQEKKPKLGISWSPTHQFFVSCILKSLLVGMWMSPLYFALAFDVCSYLELCTIWGLGYHNLMKLQLEVKDSGITVLTKHLTISHNGRWTLPSSFFQFPATSYSDSVQSGFG